MLNAFILVAAIGPSAPFAVIATWAALAIGVIAMVIASRLKQSRAGPKTRASASAIRRTARNALLFGLLWGVVPVLFFADATIGGKVVIVSLCAGMIGGGSILYLSVPTAAIALIGPIVFGSIWTLTRSAGPEAGYAIVLTLVYASLLIRASFVHTLELFRKFASNFETEHLSRRDSLTELDNAATFRGVVTEAVMRLDRAEQGFAVFMVELDDMKNINRMRGHDVGDEILIKVAGRLRALLRGIDRLARIDSDQFAILAPGLTGETTVRAYAARIAQAFAPQFEVDGGNLNLSANVGGFPALSSSLGAVTVMRNAELALRKAQSKGSGSFYVYGPHDDAAMLERNALERDLRQALERGELRLAFQPMMHMASGRTTGFEALLRWRNPARGDIPPVVFIPIAEEAGLIEAIGAWVIREACAVAATWPTHIKVCVNVSAFQLGSMSLCAKVTRALEDAGIPASRLEIEVTESVLIGDDRMPINVLTALRNAGVRLALDDFGTGYSSLSYLRRLPFDRIKIDRSFIIDIANDAGSAAIVKAVITLARDLGLDVIAEGIETHEQLDTLRALGCPEIQGYLIGKPMADSDIPAYLKALTARTAA